MRITLQKAIHFAATAHENQVRKITGFPFIKHPLTVGMLLLERKCSSQTVIAGILHDVVEDTDVSLEDIEKQFGKEVADIVRECTEDKNLSWEERKQHTIDNIPKFSDEACLVICVGQLDNLKETWEAMRLVDDTDSVWHIFNRGRDQQRWYYTEVLRALSERKFDDRQKLLLWDLENMLQRVFTLNLPR